MPSLSQRHRRRAVNDEHEDEPPRQRRRTPAEEEDGEEEAGEEEEAEYEEEEEEEEEAGPSRRSRPSQSQRRRQKAAVRRNDDGGEDDENEDGATHTEADRQKIYRELLAKKLVRYAMACEPRRIPIRRQAVKEQVLNNEGRHFMKVFPIAQEQLQTVFGMRLVEWPARDESTMSVRERRKALKAKGPDGPAKKAAAPKTGAAAVRADRYVLLSTLSDAYREAVFAAIPPDTAMPNPPAPDAAYAGFCTLVVALITLSGGAMAHADLEKYLALLHSGRHGPVRADEDFLLPIPATMGDHIDDDDAAAAGGQHNDGETAAQGGTLQYLVRQGYVVRVVEEPTTAEGRGPVGGRGTSGSNGIATGAKVTWHVGPRGRLEIGPAEVAAVVRHIYGPDADAGLERRLQSSLRAAATESEPRPRRQNDGL